ncbi:MAG: LysR family transcriptional regulator [Gammaproteobacteria bacterium]|nr:LysR family transcriptional regulator [Gammaproteobacteria bacterium]
MHITIRQLKIFDAVARNLSFTRAADELHLTQPAVSMQIKQLEAAVGIPLFDILGKKVHVTEAGEVLLKHAQKIMAQLSATEKEIDTLRGINSGRLRVAIASTVNYFAAKLLSQFCQDHPNISVSLDVVNREVLLQRLEDNEPDIVLMGRPPADLDVAAEAFMENPLIVIAAPHHPLAGEKAIPLHVLDNEIVIMREPGSGTRIAIERFFTDNAIHPSSSIEMTSNEAIKQSVEAGLGLAIVSAHTVELELSVSKIVQLDVESFPIMRHWYIAHRRGRKLSATAQAFKEFVLTEGERVQTERESISI